MKTMVGILLGPLAYLGSPAGDDLGGMFGLKRTNQVRLSGLRVNVALGSGLAGMVVAVADSIASVLAGMVLRATSQFTKCVGSWPQPRVT